MRSTGPNTFGSMSRSSLQILLTCHAQRRPRLVPPEPGPKVNSVNLNGTGPMQSASWPWESIPRKSFRPLQNTDRTSGIQRLCETHGGKSTGRNPGGFFRGGEKSSGPLRPSPSRSEAWLFTPALARFLMDAIPVLPTDHHGQDLIQSSSL